MTVNKSSGGKRNKCSCGRLILHVQTSKSCKTRPCKRKVPKSTKVLRALTYISRKPTSQEDDSTVAGSTYGRVGNNSREHPSTVPAPEVQTCRQCLKTKGQSQEIQSSTNIPLLQRLRVVCASNHKPDSPLARPLPKEVVLGGGRQRSHSHESSIGLVEKYTECSELGFDGISPTNTMSKRFPVKFTFDGVASKSWAENEAASSEENDGMQTGTILDDLVQSERGGRTCFGEFEPPANEPLRARSRTVSTSELSADMSIELSADDVLQPHTPSKDDDPYNIFSPTRFKNNQVDSSNAVTSLSNEMAKKLTIPKTEEPTTSWFNLSFLKIS